MSYNLAGDEVERRLAGHQFALVPIASIEEVLQYGCSQRATVEPVGVPILRMNNLQAEGWDFTNLKYVQISDDEITRWRLERGDIVFNRTNSKELVGKCEVFDHDGTWVFASYLMRLRVDRTRAEPEFVAAFLGTRAGRLQIDRESRQIIGMSNINAEEIRTLRVPLPTLQKQRALLLPLKAAREARRRRMEEAESLLRGLDAFVLEALGFIPLPSLHDRTAYAVRLRDVRQRFDPDYNSPRFRALRAKIDLGKNPSELVGNLFAPIISGFAAGGNEQTDNPSIGVAHIRPLNISGTAELHFEGTKMIYRSAVLPGDFLKPGEILFNNTNSTAWVGKTVVFDAERECTCSNHMTRLTLVDQKHNPYYFAALFNALRGLGYFASLSTNFNNQAGINADTLRAVRLPVPDDYTQKKIAAEVYRRRAAARHLRRGAIRIWQEAICRFEAELLGPDN